MNIDAVIINRILPAELADSYFKDWIKDQQQRLHQAHDFFNPIPIFPVNLFNGEAIGYDHLKRLGDQIYGPQNPLERFYTEEPYNLKKVNGHYHLKLKLPFVTKKDIELNKLFDELIIRIGSFKRHILLPKQVAAFDAVKARVDGQHLNIIFEGGSHGQ
jgi:arsenite-transporting ATPase